MLLSEQDRKQFRRYLMSPYFHVQPRYVVILDVIEQQLLRYKLRALTEEQAWGHAFPNLPYDQNRFRKDCTAILQLLTEFLAQQAFEEDRPQRAHYLLQRLNALGEQHYFPGYAEAAQQAVTAAQAAGENGFDHWVHIGMERYRHDLARTGRSSEVAVAQLVEAAELAYCAQKMELLYVELNHWLTTGKGSLREDTPFLELVQDRLPHLQPLTRMHFHLYHCTRFPAHEAHYLAFRDLLQMGNMPPRHLGDMYTAALNYCARRLNAGASHFLRETHHLHREMLTLGLLAPDHQRMSPNFKNAMVVASRLGEFAWAQTLVQHFEPILRLPDNLHAYHYGMGVVAYHQGYLAQAEPHFHRVLDGVEDIYYGLDTRGYLLRIYYETHNIIGLEALLESYRMYLKRNRKLLSIRKANHHTFIRFVRRLTHVNPHDRPALQRLQQDIHQGLKIPTTAWLLEKVEALLATCG